MVPVCTLVARVVYGFGLIFMYCEIGNNISVKFYGINNALYDLDWNTFPQAIRRMMPTILIVSQQPQQLTAFGGGKISRETFKRVIFI